MSKVTITGDNIVVKEGTEKGDQDKAYAKFWWDAQKDGPCYSGERDAVKYALSAIAEERYADAADFLADAYAAKVREVT